MTDRTAGIDDVYTALLEQIGSGAIPVGSKLPSCRALAEQLRSNPSTVNRAIRRLARHGLVRTEPRRGVFLVGSGATATVGTRELEQQFGRAIAAAKRAGLGTEEIREMFGDVLAGMIPSTGTIAFVECNEWDLNRMSAAVENATGVTLEPVLLDDFPESWDRDFDVVSAPIFHLADLASRSIDMDRVVELVFVPEPSVLRELATLRADAAVAVMAPTDRGVERMRSLVGQYYGGDIHVTGPGESFAGIDVVVMPSASAAQVEGLENAGRVIVIEWTLDPTSAASFPSRVAAALGA